MNEDQITSLAREYAESRYPEAKTDEDDFLYDSAVYVMEDNLRWLLQRYCLVEKEAIRKEYESVKDTPDDCNYEEHGATWDETPYLSRFYDEGYDCGQKNLLESLFPEIAKEVQP